MKSVPQCLMLCAILAIALCFDSDESNESYEDVFLRPNRANTFMSTPGRNNLNYFRGMKSPYEQRSEICEVHHSCRLIARRFGSQAAYNMVFGRQQPNSRRRY